MKCLLCDINPAMREAWEKELERRPRLAALCSVVAGGITDLRVDAVVSPANSFGFMRGGVDGVYTRVFGEGVESRLQAIIRTLPAEELPVGEALIVPTGHTGIPWLISAPTMRRPSVLHDGDPVRRSARAAMRAGLEQAFASIAFPGMGTGTGRLPFDVAAKAMFDGMEEALFSPR
ncbi:macro domain-containing protein [Bilophila wadsworthia]|jgi:O-acetyl-ADP-ribose deacetylase (regulator of RNase III)|uniref:macro domain-containing protein n=1 Tax=Bilophila wadsworthia TaxID=35833 RepID=UPI001D9B66F0|nr:macro domain-containing protein [Bilophila wadsworthia]MBS5375181.1 macro domain-containing protein [Bilophila wadsworthia]